MWELYRKTVLQSMRPYTPGEDLTEVSVSKKDTPELGGMIAQGSDDDAFRYVSKTFFEQNYKPAGDCNCYSADFVRHIQNHLGIARHRAMHRDRQEDCTITYTWGDIYFHRFSTKKHKQQVTARKVPKGGHIMENKCMGCSNLVFAGMFGFYTCRKAHEIIDVPEKIDNSFRHHPCTAKPCPDRTFDKEGTQTRSRRVRA